MKKEIKSSSSGITTFAVVAGSLAGLAAAGYFFLGPQGKKNQKHAKAWAIKMKGDVVEKLEKAKEITEPIYHQIIDVVAKDYEKSKKAGGSEISELAADLKKHWKSMSKLAKAAKNETVKDAKKIASKAK